MRPFRMSSTFLLAFSILFSIQCAIANPLRAGGILNYSPLNGLLQERGTCDGQLCGWAQTLCCSGGQQCYTDPANNQASCGQVATRPPVSIATVTIVLAPTAASGGNAICNLNLNEQSCGPICCAAGQFCQFSGSCVANAATSGNFAPVTATVVQTQSNSAFIRPTSITTATVIATGSITTTVPFIAPTGTNGADTNGITAASSGGGLSAGAIAGIVIGVLLALFLLFLLLLFCCFRAIFDTIFGRRRKVEETYIEGHHSHHGSGRPGRTWYGGRPSRPSKNDGNRFGGLAAVGGILAALAVLLGLKRRRDRKEEEKQSYAASSYVSYSDYTSASSESSRSDDRRTRDSRRPSGRR